jgi:predicted amidohydrolase
VVDTGTDRSLRVGVIQFAPVFGDKAGNTERALAQAASVEAELLVLPELFNSGYQFLDRDEVRELAEPLPDGPTTQRLIAFARQRGCHLAAGLAELDGERLYNSACLVGPGGVVGAYRKAHLFERETLLFEPGDTGFPVFDLGFVRVGLLVCFDWRFPEAARSLALKGADLILHPANLVRPWCQEVMRTRSQENGLYTATANRVGREQRGGLEELTFTGRSQVTDTDGELLFRLGTDEETVRAAAIQPARARDKQRGLNHLFKHRRPDLYEL